MPFERFVVFVFKNLALFSSVLFYLPFIDISLQFVLLKMHFNFACVMHPQLKYFMNIYYFVQAFSKKMSRE